MTNNSHYIALSPQLPIRVLGNGTSLPQQQAYSHADLLKALPDYADWPESKIQTLAEKTQKKFGFHSRHWSISPKDILDSNFPHHTTSEDLAFQSAQLAYEQSHQTPIEFLVHGTTTTSRYTGSQAPAILQRLNSHAPGIELKAGCSTSLVSLHTAFAYLSMGYSNVMVSCAETLSKTVNPKQLETIFLLADGGASVWLEHNASAPQFIVNKSLYHTDGAFIDTYTTPGRLPPTTIDLHDGMYRMQGDGQKLREQAERRYNEMLDTLFPEKAQKQKISWVIPHQINRPLIDSILDKHQIHANVQWDADTVGNIGGSSVLYSLAKLIQSQQLKYGDEILLMSVGGGLSFAMQHWTWVEKL